MTKDILVPLLRYLIAGLVGLLAGWLGQKFGIEVTEDNRKFLTDTLTVIGLALVTAVTALVSKSLKPWFLRNWHPGGSQDPRSYNRPR